jgi:hypothetical protein
MRAFDPVSYFAAKALAPPENRPLAKSLPYSFQISVTLLASQLSA